MGDESGTVTIALSSLDDVNKYYEFPVKGEELVQGGHKPGKHGKPGKLKEFEKLSKSQGNLNFCRKNLENSGKMKNR